MQSGGRSTRGGAVPRAGLIVALLLLVALGRLGAAALAQPAADAGPFFVEADSIRVVYWGEDRGVAERALAAAQAPLPLPGIPEAASLRRGTIFLAPTPALFDSLTFGGTPAWAAGVAIPAQRMIILPTYNRSGPFGD
ncbi:MAG TPA: hypothetical protein VMN39_00500, partial [Longimicrobiaceae bacterium]|nr:hypothetical protein [Longimicrobiaceae bacterium]